ncbi:MAG: hypothetical protein EBZ36_18315, partial [Acidobacteria bacterium]|nr:hypothetical protein [Acidobacteriota bacterium]
MEAIRAKAAELLMGLCSAGGEAPMFSEEEIAEAVRYNRRLAPLPRFRAPHPVVRAAIQGLISLSGRVRRDHGSGVTCVERRIEHRGGFADLRILRPSGPVRGIHIDYHGGGWTIGRASMGDDLNARIAEHCQLAVVSVDYPLLPRTSLPAMIDVCTSAADWVFEHGQGEFGARSVTMGGESAGAHLALCAALGLRDIRQDFDRLSGLVLFYGPYDLTGSDSARRAGPDTLILDGPRLVSGLERLTRGLGDDAGRHPRFSPLYANLEGLPPTMLLVGDRASCSSPAAPSSVPISLLIWPASKRSNRSSQTPGP